MENGKVNQFEKTKHRTKELVLTPEEKKRLTDFFAFLIIEIDRRVNVTKFYNKPIKWNSNHTHKTGKKLSSLYQLCLGQKPLSWLNRDYDPTTRRLQARLPTKEVANRNLNIFYPINRKFAQFIEAKVCKKIWRSNEKIW